MSTVLKGKPTADALDLDTTARAESLKAKGVTPTLAILRVGEREDDLAYERGALKRAEKNGVAVKQVLLPADVTQDELLAAIRSLNEDDSVHGVLMFRPLPKHLDENEDQDKPPSILNNVRHFGGWQWRSCVVMVMIVIICLRDCVL